MLRGLVLERVHKTRKPVLVTRFGKPVAEVAPPSAPDRPASWLGSMAGTGRIVGDIVSPASDSEWLWSLLEPQRLSRRGPGAWIPAALKKVPFREATLTHEVAVSSEGLVLPHRDPADSFLAASAKVYGLTLVTADENLAAGEEYAVVLNR